MTKKSSFISFILFFLCIQIVFPQKNSPWTRIATPDYDLYAPVTLANGKFGITLSEKALTGNMVRLNGVFDIFPDKMVESSIAAIDFTNLELIVMEPEAAKTEQADFLKGKSLSKADLTQLENWQQEFNFREGWFKTMFSFESLRVKHTVFALKHMLHTGIIKITIMAEEDKFFSLKNILRVAPPYEYNESKYLDQLRNRQIPLMTASAYTPTGKYLSATTSSFYFEGSDKPDLVFTDDDKQQPTLGFEKMLKKGESITFYLIGSMATTETYTDPISETARLNIYTYLTGPEKIIKQHKTTWNSFWEKTDIVIDGAPELNKDIRQMMFFINSFVPEGTDYSSACMGLGRDAWGYKTLWDADFWIYPALLLINPEAAKSMLEYRWKRLNMAKQNALAHGYKGAMFPWESGSSGEEQTSLLYLTGPFQHHITSNVGLAFWRYYTVTQDKDWLKKRGYPLLKEVAAFWVSRAEKNEQGTYEIRNVVSADEHAINVDNDAFTNAGAISVLKAATKAARIVDEKPDHSWNTVANGLVIRSFDNGITREHDTYNGETIKQAATNLASFPLDIITDKALMQRNLDYYEPRVDEHGPNMTWPMYAGAAARAGNPDKALYFFEKALLPYKKGPFAILALRPYLTTTFFGTSSGGLLQAFIMGFGGLHFTEEGLIQKDPVLPKKWRSIEYKGIGNNQTFDVK